MKFGHIMEYKKRKRIFHKSYLKWGRETIIPDFFLLSKKVLFNVKASVLQLGFNKFR